MLSAEEPPYYILVSHNSALDKPARTSLSHPVIEYHYADDSPHSLLPQFPGEQIVVLDYDPAKNPTPTVKSLSTGMGITGLKITDAPGIGIAEDEFTRNNKMYVIETTSMPEEKCVLNACVDWSSCQFMTVVWKKSTRPPMQSLPGSNSGMRSYRIYIRSFYSDWAITRNAVLRRVLDFPEVMEAERAASPSLPAQSPSG